MENTKSIFADLSDRDIRSIRLINEMEEKGIKKLVLTKEPQKPDPPVPLGAKVIKLTDMDSFISFCKKNGSKEKSVLYFTDQVVLFIMDETQTENYDGIYDHGLFNFTFSYEFGIWNEAVNGNVGSTQKGFLRFLKTNKNDILENVKLIESYESLKTKIAVNIDSQISSTDGKIIGVSLTSKTESGKTEPGKLVGSFDIEIPVIKDADEKAKFPITVELDEPEAADAPLKIFLSSPEFRDAKEKAVKAEIKKLKDDLKGWNIFAGMANISSNDLPF